MRRAVAGAAIALAFCTGSARSDTFALGSSSTASSPATDFSAQSAVLPSAEIPNSSGSLHLPAAWTEHASSDSQPSSAQLRALWQSAGAAYGIPWSVLAAINKVESNFGRNMGPSSAGAIGWMQFMPATWLRWGYDFDGDGVADPWNAKDAIFSAARYLAAAGGRADIARGVYAYNHAQWYVDEVLSLAGVLGSDTTLPFELDAMQVSLERAEKQVASISLDLSQTRARVRALEKRQQGIAARAERAPLLSDRSNLRMRAAKIGASAYVLAQRLPQLEQSLQTAEQALKLARDRSRASSFNPATAPYLGSPSYGDGYVFPVGGGPSRVSVGRTHHDYPAADIAAPSGSPVYALADGVVERAWRTIDPLCGIGFVFRTDDGRTWAYCHLAYLEPSMQAGLRLPAGATVGLVGSTGHSTGPHLHLGLRPATGYPQDEPWFQRFAGLSFRWQDEPSTVAVDDGPLTTRTVFAVVVGSQTGGAATTPATEGFTTAAAGTGRSEAPTPAQTPSEGGLRSVFGMPPGSTTPAPPETPSEPPATGFTVASSG